MLKDNIVERLVAFIAFGCLMAVILGPSRPRVWQESLGDFKMVYASAASLAETGDAYSFDGLARAHRENNVVVPVSWYGHSPVYPPFTLLALSPLLLLPMVTAAYVWACLGYVAMAAAAFSLTRYAARVFDLPLSLRVLIIALMAASPLASFGLELANLSVVASCLCILAVTAPAETSIWLRASWLAAALLLKPHLAFWIVLALLLVPYGRNLAGERTVAVRTFALFSAVLATMAAGLALRHRLLPLLQSYVHMLGIEAKGGSMDVHAREIMPMAAHIPSLGSLLGYWIQPTRTILLLQVALLLPLAACLVWATPRMLPHWKIVVAAAWETFGMLVTYHRGHDGVVLFLLVPWALARVSRRWYDFIGWAAIALYALFSIDMPPGFYPWLSAIQPVHALAQLLLYRQGAIAAMLLAIALVAVLVRGAALRLDALPPP